MKRTAATKNIDKTKREDAFVIVWSLAYNLSHVSGTTMQEQVPVSIACKITDKQDPPPTPPRKVDNHRTEYEYYKLQELSN